MRPSFHMLRNRVTEYSLMKPTAVSLQDLYRYNLHGQTDQRLRNAQFLHKELPIRLACRIEELSSLPFGLARKQGVVEIKEVFLRGFESLLEQKAPQTVEDDERFTALLSSILMDNRTVIQSMAESVLETRMEIGNQLTPERSAKLDKYLNRFFMARIGLRFLLEHHIKSKNNAEGFSGIIQSSCNPMEVAQNAADESMQLCENHYGVTPLIRIQSPNPDTTFTYVPAHLHYILSELLKNALRATVNFHGVDNENLPVVDVVIARGRSDVTIKISDRGGGIPFEKVGLI
jgi:pyruvate dehydrogenase kinase 2/3/4